MFPYVEFERSTTLIQALILVIIYSTLSMIILLIFILFHRIKLQNLKILNQSLKEKYQSYLMDYLFDETHTNDIIKKIKYEAADLYRSTILVDEMRDLMVNLTGDSANKLRKLFYNLKLDADSKKKFIQKNGILK